MKKISLFIIQIIIIFNISIKNVHAAININEDNLNLGINYSLKLNISGDTTGNVIWSSSNPNIATVNNGIVTGISYGTTYITASNGNSADICKINIINNYVPIENLTLSKTTTTISINEISKITLTINPSNASNKNVYYSSSDSSIVSVDKLGNITGKKVGTAYISIYAEDKATSYKVIVTNNVSLKSISIPKSLTLEENSTSKLIITYSPSNATNKNVTWKSNNPDIVTVDNSGNLKAISKGTATIIATSKDGNHIATSQITVTSVDKSLKSISLNKKELTLEVGESETLTVTYNPNNAENKKITWSSINEKIATVKNGEITAISPGTTEIKAISDDGNYEVVCKITVLSLPIEKIAFLSKELEVYLGSNTTLDTISTPENTAINNPIWTSSDETIATVESGIVTALNLGSTTITISDEFGKVTASIIVNVIPKPEENLLITIEGYDLNFDPNIKNYTLFIKDEDSLNIQVNRDSSKVIIGGNRDLKNGSIITVTINDDDNKTTYVINIKKKQSYSIYFIIIISTLLLINIIRLSIKNKKNK